MASKSKTRFIRARIAKISSQRLQYKPYGYELDTVDAGGGKYGRPVFVEFEIPEDTVIQDEPEVFVVSLDGLNAILEVTADSLDKLDAAYKKKLQGG